MNEKEESEKFAAQQMEQMVKQLQDKELEFERWICHACQDEPQFEHADFEKHLSEIHQIDISTAKGTRKMKMHMDGRDWFQTNYDVVINGLKFTHMVRNERAEDDMMRFI